MPYTTYNIHRSQCKVPLTPTQTQLRTMIYGRLEHHCVDGRQKALSQSTASLIAQPGIAVCTIATLNQRSRSVKSCRCKTRRDSAATGLPIKIGRARPMLPADAYLLAPRDAREGPARCILPIRLLDAAPILGLLPRYELALWTATASHPAQYIVKRQGRHATFPVCTTGLSVRSVATRCCGRRPSRPRGARDGALYSHPPPYHRTAQNVVRSNFSPFPTGPRSAYRHAVPSITTRQYNTGFRNTAPLSEIRVSDTYSIRVLANTRIVSINSV